MAGPVQHLDRGRGIGAAIVGAFAWAWFGWSMATPLPVAVELLSWIGIVAAVVVVALGVRLAIRSPAGSSVLSDPAGSRRYGIVVGVETVTIFAGATLLGATGQPEWIPVWIALVVGVHFVPLAPVLHDPGLRVLAGLVVAVALAALITGLATGVAPSVVAGLGTGTALLIWAAATLADRSLYPGRPGRRATR